MNIVLYFIICYLYSNIFQSFILKYAPTDISSSCLLYTFAGLGTINFRFFTNQRENQGAEFTSRLPVFYVIHMIIRSYLEYKRLGDTHDSII